MKTLASLVAAVALSAAVLPGVAAAKPATRHHYPIAHMANVHASGTHAHAQTGPR